MYTKYAKALILIVFVTAFFPSQRAAADIGPKPSMTFEFAQEFAGDAVQIVQGTQLECEQPDCRDEAPLKAMGAQHFSCTKNTCSSSAYGFAPYHRLELTFSDGVTRRSNIFETDSFNNQYKVLIRQEDLLVESVVDWGWLSTALWIAGCGCLCVALMALVVAACAAYFVILRKRNAQNP